MDIKLKNGAPHWVYKKLASLWTSIYVLLAAAFFYLLGTIFPQGAEIEDYIEAGGRFILLVKALSLLNIFTSPIFLLLTTLLFLNLIICTYERYFAIRALRRYPSEYTPTHIFALTQEVPESYIEVRRVLREDLGFRVVSKDHQWVTMERGLPYRWLTWLYHAGFAICFIGFLLTYLLAYESMVTLKTGEPQTIRPEERGRLARTFGGEPTESEFSIILDEFKTEYVESPELEYPEDGMSRLAMGLGWRKPDYKLTPQSMVPKDWKSKLRVLLKGLTVKEKTIEVNDPLKYGGYTFYQIAFDHNYKVLVNDEDPVVLDAEANVEVTIPGLDATLEFGTLKNGTVYRMDETVQKITPSTTVKKIITDPETGEKSYTELGRIELGETIDVDGVEITLEDYVESSVLSYRYDPGVPLLWWGGIFILAVMVLRFYGSWYRVAYHIEESNGIVRLSVNIISRGIASDPDKMSERLEHHLTKDEIKLTPIE